MRQAATILLIGLTSFLSASCSCPPPKLVTPELALPAHPAMLPVLWRQENGLYCISEEGAKNLQINVSRKDTHIEILEGAIKSVGGE